ncbi:MAG: MarR family transcriptional regulator [candidate division Zixibacteria bacterium]
MKLKRQGGFLIGKIHRLAGRIFTKKLKGHNIDIINPAQGKIMFVLWKNDGLSISELAAKTSLGKSTLTSMLDRLENAGHLKRVASDSDRRKFLLYRTRKDKKMEKLYTEVSEEMNRLFYKGFTKIEILQFENNLLRVLNNLESF